MRLIDADELNVIKEKLRVFDSFISTVTRQCTDEHQAIYEHWIDCRYDIENAIDKQPTAYDVEKVVAELGKWSSEVQVVSEVEGKIHRVKVVNAERAINIARKGGVE